MFGIKRDDEIERAKMDSWTHPELEEKPEEESNALEDGPSDVIPNELSAEEVMEPSCLGFELGFGFGRGLRRRMRGRRGRGRSSSGNMSSVSAYHSWRKRLGEGQVRSVASWTLPLIALGQSLAITVIVVNLRGVRICELLALELMAVHSSRCQFTAFPFSISYIT
jgi:hypothetical protein